MQQMTQKTKQKTQRKLLYLAIFLGFFGIHDFYARNKKKGCIKLALCVSFWIFGAISVQFGHSLPGLIAEVLSSLFTLLNTVLVFVDIIKIVKNKYPIAENESFLQNVNGRLEKVLGVWAYLVAMLRVLVACIASIIPYFKGPFMDSAQSVYRMERKMKSFVELESAFIAKNHRAGYFEEIKYDMMPEEYGVVRVVPDQDRSEGYVTLLGGFMSGFGGCKENTVLGITYAVNQGFANCHMVDANTNTSLSSEDMNVCLAEMPVIKAICKGFVTSGMEQMKQKMESFVEQESAFIAQNHRAGYFEEIKYDMTPVDYGSVMVTPVQDRSEGYVTLLNGFGSGFGGCKKNTVLGITYTVNQGFANCHMVDVNTNTLLSPEDMNACLAEMPEIKAICEGFEKAYSGVAEQSILD